LGYSAVSVDRYRCVYCTCAVDVSAHNLVDLVDQTRCGGVSQQHYGGCTTGGVIRCRPKNGRYVDYVGICHDDSLEAEDH